MAEALTLNMCDIDEPELALRLEMDDEQLNALVQSMRAVGQIVPIRVKRKGDRFEVVDGHRRYKAAQILNLLTIRGEVEDGSDQLSEARKLHANLIREDNTDAEIAVYLQQLVEKHGATEQQLCDMMKRSADWIGDRMRLLRGDEHVFHALQQRQISFSVAKALNRCKDDKYRDYYLKHAIQSGAPARTVDNWINSIPLETGETPAAPAAAASVAVPAAAGNGAIACGFCGGGLDPWNLLNVWIHPHEWAMILKLRDQQEVNA